MTATFPCAALIKEIGRGARGAKALSADVAQSLYAAMLAGQVSDLELGAVLMAYRIKGEAPEELAGMLRAAHADIDAIAFPDKLDESGAVMQGVRPVSIPSYNGARKLANLTPLLALLLAQRGIPVTVHGVRTDAGRLTSAEIFAALGVAPATSMADAATALTGTRVPVAFVPIDVLSPSLARLLQLRATLGVRNSTHTIVKLLNPYRIASIRLVNYTHPPYRDSLSALFAQFTDIAMGDILLARGTEGEAVADSRRQVQIDILRDGMLANVIAPERSVPDSPGAELPPAMDAAATADWIRRALVTPSMLPEALARQVDLIEGLSRQFQKP